MEGLAYLGLDINIRYYIETINYIVVRPIHVFFCNSFVMTYVGVKCLTRHCSVLRDTRTRGTT